MTHIDHHDGFEDELLVVPGQRTLPEFHKVMRTIGAFVFAKVGPLSPDYRRCFPTEFVDYPKIVSVVSLPRVKSHHRDHV